MSVHYIANARPNFYCGGTNFFGRLTFLHIALNCVDLLGMAGFHLLQTAFSENERDCCGGKLFLMMILIVGNALPKCSFVSYTSYKLFDYYLRGGFVNLHTPAGLRPLHLP